MCADDTSQKTNSKRAKLKTARKSSPYRCTRGRSSIRRALTPPKQVFSIPCLGTQVASIRGGFSFTPAVDSLSPPRYSVSPSTEDRRRRVPFDRDWRGWVIYHGGKGEEGKVFPFLLYGRGRGDGGHKRKKFRQFRDFRGGRFPPRDDRRDNSIAADLLSPLRKITAAFSPWIFNLILGRKLC